MRSHIIVAAYNAGLQIEKNVDMIRRQSCANFQCVLIDDLSTDDTVELAEKAIDGDCRFKLIVNREKKFKTRNVVEGIVHANPGDEDIIVLIDGDDCLTHVGVLKKVQDTYQRHNCWMTYGSYRNSRGQRDSLCRPYPQHVIDKNNFRKKKWLASHLKTFKYGLWEKLDMGIFSITPKEIERTKRHALLSGQLRTWWHWRRVNCGDLLDSSGLYIRRVDDKAFSFPMLEMSGNRAVFIDDILYQYGFEGAGDSPSEAVYGNDKSEKWHTRLIRDIITKKPSYPRLPRL